MFYVNPALEYLYHMEMDCTVDVSESESSTGSETLILKMEVACSSETSTTQSTSVQCKYSEAGTTLTLNQCGSLKSLL
jgi:hypothetical protein